MLTQTELAQITNQFEKLDCGEKEVQVYLDCLQFGASTVQEIAKRLGFNRVTAHDVVEKLVSKGLLAETRKGKRRLLVSESPTSISRLIEQKENELRVLRDNLQSIIPLLERFETTERSAPSVRFYEGVDGFKRMLEETLAAQGEVLVFTYVSLFSQLLDPEYLTLYFQRRADKGIHTRLIFPPCDFADRVNRKASKYKISIRLLPPELEWHSGIFSWNNCLAIKSFTHKKLTCTILENKDIAYFYRNIVYELAWGQAKPMK